MRQILFLLPAAMLALILAGCSGPEPEIQPDLEANQSLQQPAEAYADTPYDQLLTDPQARTLGAQLYDANCAGCHGTDRRGGRNVPDLTDQYTLWPHSLESIEHTIRQGRETLMPGMGNTLGEVALGQVVAYVQSLSDPQMGGTLKEMGRPIYEEHCAVCHAVDGTGFPELGAPDLTDGHWELSGNAMQMRLLITNGINRTCPAHGAILTDAQIRLLTAYVYRLSPLAN